MAAQPQPAYRPDLPCTLVVDADGFLTRPYSLEVQVLDPAGGTVYARVAVAVGTPPGNAGDDAVADAPLGADELALGYYRPHLYDPDNGAVDAAAAGRRTVRYFCKLESTSAETQWDVPWEKVAGGVRSDGAPRYALVADLRDEGFTSTVLPDARAIALLKRASRMVERLTGRVFAPVRKTISVNGKGGTILQLGEEVVGVGRVAVDSSFLAPADLRFGPELMRVYSRHLTQRLRFPDDRQNPKIELYVAEDQQRPRGFASYTLENFLWPRGQQNVHVDGAFGYTEPDGSPMGRTPSELALAVMLLVQKGLATVASGDLLTDGTDWRATMQRTRDQSVSFAGPRTNARPGDPILGAFTGDPTVDSILVSFVRPPSLGAA